MNTLYSFFLFIINNISFLPIQKKKKFIFIVFYFDLLTLLLGKKTKEKKGVKTYIFEPCKLDKMDLYIVMPQFD